MKRTAFLKTIKPLTLAVGILCAACLISFATLLWKGVKPDLFTERSNAEEPESNSEKLALTPDFGSFYIQSMIFVGDRSIAGMAGAGVLSGGTDTVQIWTGEDGDLSLDSRIDKTTILYPETKKSITISEAAGEKKPQYILFTLGLSNGVAYCSEETFKAYYSNLIDAVAESAPETKMILQSIFPVSKSFEKKSAGITADKIQNANNWIQELAAEKGLRYLDTAEILRDGNGYIKEEYDSGDGVVLNTLGYEKVLEYIRTHGYQ